MAGSGEPTVGVIVVAAGSGTRLALGQPKALVPVGTRSIVQHAVHSVLGMTSGVQIIVVVAPPAQVEEMRRQCERTIGAHAFPLSVVAGGATRQLSVAAGLAALPGGALTVLVHDAARAFTPSQQFDRVVSAVEETGAGIIPVVPVTDTIKQADAGGRVLHSLDRSQLVAVQTPQGFPRDRLEAAYVSATEEYTDDAALFSAAGHEVATVAGDVLAFKITTPADLQRAESLFAETARIARAVETRTGIGIDVHAFDESAPLWLGGVHWPGEVGLAGHSDGDAMSHAICDALLSAAGLGDIGGHFGTADEEFAGAHGDVFLKATVALLADEGWRVGNVSVQLIAGHPKVSPRRAEIESLLQAIVGAPVSVSATTSDGLGFTGRGEGVAAIATALIVAL